MLWIVNRFPKILQRLILLILYQTQREINMEILLLRVPKIVNGLKSIATESVMEEVFHPISILLRVSPTRQKE